MTQEEFNSMLKTALSQGLSGYYTSKFTGEEIDNYLTDFITPPPEFDLPLAENVTKVGTCTYCKNQFGEVLIQCYCTTTESFYEGSLIGTLPEGFRPKFFVSFPGIFTASSRIPGVVTIDEGGNIIAYVSTESNILIFSVIFNT